MLELWAPIAEAPAYEVSTWGKVRRGDSDVASWQNKKGYEVVSLEVPGRTNPVLRYVHQLVLAAFEGSPAANLQGNHDNGIKGDNTLDNLEWTTPSGNVAHAWARGLMPRSRVRRETCRHGHALDQAYTQRDRHGILRTYHRCARCRRIHYRRARDRARGLRSFLDQL